jgi:hypothetical protein
LLGGAKELPSVDDRVAEFVTALEATPKRVDPEEMELRAALGLRGQGG